MLRRRTEETQSVSSETEEEGEDEGHASTLKSDSLRVDNPPQAEQPSPAPAVVLGGENEFVKVSHLGSIEVNEVAKKQPSSRQRLLPIAVHRQISSSDTTEKSAKNQEPATKRLSDSTSPTKSMKKSPYEANYHAEKEEKLFVELAEALEEDKHSLGKPTLRAVEMFGDGDAGRIIKAKPLIDKSGIVFSQGWAEGNFRGTIVGKIPADLLLLCLCPNRFVKASDLELSGICRDLQLYSLISEAIDAWGLEDDFKLTKACTKNYAFTSKKRDCYKCAIFVARLYSSFKASGRTKLNNRLMTKAKVCLAVMEDHLTDTSSPNKKKKIVDHESASDSGTPLAASGTSAGAAPSAPQQPDPPKRKRGRPPKNPKPSPPSASPDKPVMSEVKKRRVESQKENPPRKQIRASVLDKQEIHDGEESQEPGPTMQRLISRFEEKYQELGDILEQIKAAARRPQQRTEEQIRADVLEEVQKSIIKSFPKK